MVCLNSYHFLIGWIRMAPWSNALIPEMKNLDVRHVATVAEAPEIY